MASRILFWNIENFGLNKINNPDTVGIQPGSTLTRNVASQQRMQYVMSNIALVSGVARPNIIVVIEIETGFDGNGQLARGAGLNGSIELLGALRTRFSDRWALVPPLQTGPNEAVSVFYDSETLVFSGPFVWPGGDQGRVSGDPNAGVFAQSYPMRYWNMFPPQVRLVPPGSRFNVGIFEDMCAARTRFTYRASAGLLANQPAQYIAQRSPYMVTFAEIDAVTKQFKRNLSIFGVHSPAWTYTAAAYMRKLAQLEQVVEPLDNTEVRVIAGDFNINLFDFNLNRAQPYTDFLQQSQLVGRPNYELILDPLNPAPGLPRGYVGYYATHIKPVEGARYWSTGGANVYYPGYEYIGSSLVTDFFAIDNLFTCYANNNLRPGLKDTTVLNGVVGTPFTVQNPPYGGGPVGSFPFPIAMANVNNPQPTAPPFSIGLRSQFHGWANYGRIRSTSDHLAVIMNV